MLDTRAPEDHQAPFVPPPPPPTSLAMRLKNIFFGRPISSEHVAQTLLPKFLALPVFASDAISSVAYATQQIVLVLGVAGLYAVTWQAQYGRYTMVITGLIVALLAIVVTSYSQTIFGYPSGGGSYIVTKDNLGVWLGLVAAAALLIDYVLTVSVSVASGVQNLAFMPLPGWLRWLHFDHLIVWCLLFILLITLANLRGLKESGSMFAVFTYGFVGCCYLLIVMGLVGPLVGWPIHREWVNQSWGAGQAAQTFGLVVLLRAFAQGCSAMTGTEAVSNGIPAFKEPKAHNAAVTLVMMGVILGSIFLGISFLAVHLHVVYWEHNGVTAPAVIDQLSGAVFGKAGRWALGYYLTQFFTAAILVLAANTSFADFPRLSSILARDAFMPKQLANLGDKLVFTNAIVVLGVVAGLLIVLKRGNVDALIPLYAVGVFTAFTLSQSGMVVHWRRLRGRAWRVRAIINGVGAVATGVVLADIAVEKFAEGAYIVIVLVLVLVLLFNRIHNHYAVVSDQLKMSDYRPPHIPLRHTVLVLVPGLHRGVMPALEYAQSLAPADCRAVYVETDPVSTGKLKEEWDRWAKDIPLVILSSPYRSLLRPILCYLGAVRTERAHHVVTVVVPEFVSTRWWHGLLHGNSGLRLKLALLGQRDVVVTNVRYYLQQPLVPPNGPPCGDADSR